MFSIYTTGILQINYGWLSTQVEEVKVKNYHQALTAIPGFSQIPADFSKWPSVLIKDVFLNKPNIIAQFKGVIEEFGEQI